MATYDNGDQVRVTGSFTTAGTLADPTGDAAGITTVSYTHLTLPTKA